GVRDGRRSAWRMTPLMVRAEFGAIEQAPENVFETLDSLGLAGACELPAPVVSLGLLGNAAQGPEVELGDDLVVRLAGFNEALQAAVIGHNLAIDQVAVELIEFGRQTATQGGC